MAGIRNLSDFKEDLFGHQAKDVVSETNYMAENDLLSALEGNTERYIKRILKALDLKSKLKSFKRTQGGNAGKELYVSFLKNHVFELLSNMNKWGEIFKTEKEDRTNRKHREHIRKMLPYLNEIHALYTLLHEDVKVKLKSNRLHTKGMRRVEFLGQNDFIRKKEN